LSYQRAPRLEVEGQGYGRIEDLIREMGEPARELTIPPQPEEPPSEAEMERMAAIAAKYGGEILGPPPFRHSWHVRTGAMGFTLGSAAFL
jgi:hypothetical protein